MLHCRYWEWRPECTRTRRPPPSCPARPPRGPPARPSPRIPDRVLSLLLLSWASRFHDGGEARFGVSGTRQIRIPSDPVAAPVGPTHCRGGYGPEASGVQESRHLTTGPDAVRISPMAAD